MIDPSATQGHEQGPKSSTVDVVPTASSLSANNTLHTESDTVTEGASSAPSSSVQPKKSVIASIFGGVGKKEEKSDAGPPSPSHKFAVSFKDSTEVIDDFTSGPTRVNTSGTEGTMRTIDPKDLIHLTTAQLAQRREDRVSAATEPVQIYQTPKVQTDNMTDEARGAVSFSQSDFDLDAELDYDSQIANPDKAFSDAMEVRMQEKKRLARIRFVKQSQLKARQAVEQAKFKTGVALDGFTGGSLSLSDTHDIMQEDNSEHKTDEEYLDDPDLDLSRRDLSEMSRSIPTDKLIAFKTRQKDDDTEDELSLDINPDDINEKMDFMQSQLNASSYGKPFFLASNKDEETGSVQWPEEDDDEPVEDESPTFTKASKAPIKFEKDDIDPSLGVEIKLAAANMKESLLHSQLYKNNPKVIERLLSDSEAASPHAKGWEESKEKRKTRSGKNSTIGKHSQALQEAASHESDPFADISSSSSNNTHTSNSNNANVLVHSLKYLGELELSVYLEKSIGNAEQEHREYFKRMDLSSVPKSSECYRVQINRLNPQLLDSYEVVSRRLSVQSRHRGSGDNDDLESTASMKRIKPVQEEPLSKSNTLTVPAGHPLVQKRIPVARPTMVDSQEFNFLSDVDNTTIQAFNAMKVPVHALGSKEPSEVIQPRMVAVKESVDRADEIPDFSDEEEDRPVIVKAKKRSSSPVSRSKSSEPFEIDSSPLNAKDKFSISPVTNVSKPSPGNRTSFDAGLKEDTVISRKPSLDDDKSFHDSISKERKKDYLSMQTNSQLNSPLLRRRSSPVSPATDQTEPEAVRGENALLRNSTISNAVTEKASWWTCCGCFKGVFG